MIDKKAYRSELSPKLQLVYDSLSAGFLSKKNSFRIYENNGEVISSVFEFVKLDFPQLYYVDSIKWAYDGGLWGTTVLPIYNHHLADSSHIDSQIKNIGQTIASRVKELDAWNKLLYIHDVICNTVRYNTSCADAHNIVGAMLNKQAVCDGISKTFKFMCDIAKVKCCVVNGRAKNSFESFAFDNHAWNKVMINGAWFNVDVTFDLTIGSRDCVRHDYFMVTDESIKSSHIENKSIFPATTIGKDYYTINNLLMNTQKDLVNYIKVNYKNGVRYFEVKLPSSKNIDLVEEKVLNVVSSALEFQKIVFKTEVYSNKDMLVFGIMVS